MAVSYRKARALLPTAECRAVCFLLFLKTQGYLKSVICQSLGLNPEACKLVFGGIEKQDGERLQQAGLKDNSDVLLVESVCEQPVPEEVQETPVASKGEEAVAEARKERDNLEQHVSALQAVIDSRKKADEKEIMYLTEMLMRQLLKLDGIDAEGEGRARRKAEVTGEAGDHALHSSDDYIENIERRPNEETILAAGIFVFKIATEETILAAYGAPPLNPDHPIHRSPAPASMSSMLVAGY